MKNTHKELDVWNKSISFVSRVYEVTREYPRDELYGMTFQMRRAAVSVPSNISEGAARQSTKEYVRFLYISLGSASELDVQLTISLNLGYLLIKCIWNYQNNVKKYPKCLWA